MDVEEYLQQFTLPNHKPLQNHTINTPNLLQQPSVIADVACGGSELTDSDKVVDGVHLAVTDDVAFGDRELKTSVTVHGVADVACGSELMDSVKADGAADVACIGSELTVSVELDGVPLAVTDDVACGDGEVTESVKAVDGVDDVERGSELTDSVKVHGAADVACCSELTDSVELDSVPLAVTADVACSGGELTDSDKVESGALGVDDDVACCGGELTDSVKVQGVADVACCGGELTDSVKVDGVADVADGVECEKTGVDDVADGVECEKTGVDDVADGVECEKTGLDYVARGSELPDSVKLDGVSLAVGDDVACYGSDLKDSVKLQGVDDVAYASEFTDSVKVDGTECKESGVADMACGDSELTDSVKVDGVECEGKIIGESEPEAVRMDVIAEGDIVVSDSQDKEEGKAVDVQKQNDGNADMVTDGKDDAVGGKAALIKEERVVADKEEGKADNVENQNDEENEEAEAVKTCGRIRKREESLPVKKRGRPKKTGTDSSKATPKSSSVKISGSEEDEDFEPVKTPPTIKKRGRPRKSEGSAAKATPKSVSMKMIKKEDMETESQNLPIKKRGRPRKSGGDSSKAVLESTSVKTIEEDVETKLPDPSVKKLGRPRKSGETSPKAALESTSLKMVNEDEDVEAVDLELPDPPVKKFGRPRKSEGNSHKATLKSASVKTIAKEEEEEDVCFICFDGGELVLCDRRGCPKAYHHSCIDRDEAFFQTKGQWSCGWHLCSICAKNAEYLCYTCTFSLCKACTKTNVIFCVREEEKKGFCEPCMKIAMLIENKSQGTQEDVDFDDKDSWEYTFKEYWTDMQPKLNISLAELLEAKNAWKGSSPVGEQEPPAVHSDGGSGSEKPSENPESQTKNKRKIKSNNQKTIDSAVIASEGTPVPESENTEWATEELLEFVAHMGNNRKSYQSQFDVQALLLEYIKTNKLRDPHKKSQIICDSRFIRLFGKPRVGHFEMLKLLESHFLIKKDSKIDKSVVDTEVGLVDDDEDYGTAKRDRKDKKRKIHKKADWEPQSNREDFAAIDVHNINLIYLKRKFLEDLLDNTETFNSKVVGTFVRIRTQGANKQEIYRLVQVTGTTKGENYVVGKKMTDIMLEILNLDRTECVTIDIISNHDFTEDECKRLRQSMKCGLIKSPKVGDVLDKATELQAVRVNDWLEAEVVRISHLRDRASDLGRKKELRECVEKLQLLKAPEERARRLQDIPVIHDDPTMDPNRESENDADENDKKQDMYKSSLSSNYSKSRDYPSKESWSSTWAGTSGSSGKTYEVSRNLSDNKVEDAITAARFKPHNEKLLDQGGDLAVQPPSILEKPSSTNETEKNMSPTENISEIEEMWHYRDPSGKIQGPFSMAKLRKWNNSKFFPVDLRIWKKSEKEGDSFLLTDALEGRFSVDNLPSPTPIRTIANSGLVVPSVFPGLYNGGNEELQSHTPLGTGQNLSVGLYNGSFDPQPNPNMGSGNQSLDWGTASHVSWSVAAGACYGNQSLNWGTASQGSWPVAAGAGNGNQSLDWGTASQGAWSVEAGAGNGNQSLDWGTASQGAWSVEAGAGNGNQSLNLGTASQGAWSVAAGAGNGNQSLGWGTASQGAWSVEAGAGNGNQSLDWGTASQGAWSVEADAGNGNQSLNLGTASQGAWSVEEGAGNGNQSLNRGTASQYSWSLAAGPSNVSPDWVASRGPSQGPSGSGNGNSKSMGRSGSSPTARNHGYKRRFSEDKRDSRHRSSSFRDDRRKRNRNRSQSQSRDRHRSFNRRRSRDSDRY